MIASLRVLERKWPKLLSLGDHSPDPALSLQVLALPGGAQGGRRWKAAGVLQGPVGSWIEAPLLARSKVRLPWC